jgi:hypothetical protein
VCVCVCDLPRGACREVFKGGHTSQQSQELQLDTLSSWSPSCFSLETLGWGEQEEEISPDMAPCCPLVLTSEIATQTQDLGAFPGHGFWFIAGSSLVGQE